ncbi:alpha/beta hydrolase [Aidingimonas halophila]|uniref:Serine aminopeptidase S33 domain-containing protein n=1 Tax=Aidingimonas halophila TaxID=574349 RepID=A0A1H2UWP0_9GAMM|nr:alpha/beta hydrolase [Aidingimonas halophila]GHC23307.1 alpha/beta hydrolase [Aidingimonas halophila]SDW60507.1 hypothetical protein SAMN05443545_102260 [Aidingimonas halophila]
MWRVLLWAILIYVLIVLLAWLFQDRLLYLPHTGRDYIATPDEYGLSWESVSLESEDDITLDGWWLPAEKERGSLLFFHGNAGNISHRLDSLSQFHQLGLSVLIIDYRGYGRSEGKPSEAGTAKDARAAWQWLRERREADRIVIFGRSLGSAVTAELARDVSPAAVILESPFRSVPLMAQQMYPFLPARWLSRFGYHTIDYVTELDAPLLVVHSRDDDVIPFYEGQAVFEAAREPKTMLEISGSHNAGFLDSEPEYLDGIDTFLVEEAGMSRD